MRPLLLSKLTLIAEGLPSAIVSPSRPKEPRIASGTVPRSARRSADDSLTAVAVLALLLAGPALGLFAWQSDRVETIGFSSEVVRALGNVPSPWLGLAFLTGAVIARPGWGALAAATVLCLAVATYYVAITVSGDREGIPLRGAFTGWLAVALVAGPIFGLAGSIWRSGPRALKPLAVGLLSGALVGEVAYFTGRSSFVTDSGSGTRPATTWRRRHFSSPSPCPFCSCRASCSACRPTSPPRSWAASPLSSCSGSTRRCATSSTPEAPVVGSRSLSTHSFRVLM